MHLPKAPLPLSRGAETTLHALPSDGASRDSGGRGGLPCTHRAGRRLLGPSFLLSRILSVGVPLGLSPSPGEPPLPPSRPPGPWREGTRPCHAQAWPVHNSPHPELAQRVDVLRLEEGVVVAVHQALPVDNGRVVHQDGDVTHLQAGGAAALSGPPRAWPPPPGPGTWAATLSTGLDL